MESKLSSRKFWITIIALVIILAIVIFLPEKAAESLDNITKIVIVYIGGQGAVDVAKQIKKKVITVGDDPS